MKYVFAMMDDETRFWIAQEVADSKAKHEARHLFYESSKVAGKTPARAVAMTLRKLNPLKWIL
jgi:hypothetical protein